jgi:HEAT repeat protein
MEAAAKQDYGFVLTQMNGAIRRLEMYPAGHPATLQALEKPFSALQKIFEGTDLLTISLVEDKVIINGKNVEGTDLLKRLIEEFQNENIRSLTITKSLTKEELNKFLSFFVRPLGESTHTTSLPEFVRKNDIGSIKIDQLRYELVTEDEVVVKSEVVEGADLKAQISNIMKENPDLVRDVVLNKSVKQEQYAERLGTDIDLKQMADEIGKQIKNLSDDDVLSLLASSLDQSLRRPESLDSGSVLKEVRELVKGFLENREKARLLPQVKKILSESGMVKKEHLDFLFEERWLKSQEVLDELVGMIERPGTEEMDFERFMFLWEQLTGSEETKIKSYAMDKLLSKLDSEDSQVRGFSVSALEQALSHFAAEKMESEFSHIRDQVYEKIKNRLMPTAVLKDCSRLLKVIFSEAVQRRRLKEAQTILLEYNARLGPQIACPADVERVASDFIREVSDERTLSVLTSQIREGIPHGSIKLTEEILESLDKDKVAKRLLDVFTLDDRAARMSALRVLSRLGKSSVSTFSALLSSPGFFVRKEGDTALADQQWYRVRNIIYVLGNIPDQESVTALSKLGGDPDVRVRLEVVKALEKIGSGKSANALLGLLKDEDHEVRRKVIASLTTMREKSSLTPLTDHFRGNQQDRRITLTAIAKIGGEESTPFLLSVLQKDEGIRDLAHRQKDEIKIEVLDILGKMGSSELAGEIEKFVKQRGKGLMNLLVKDRVTESANRALEMIEAKNEASRSAQEERSAEGKVVS